jgi:hypothetical protein
MASKTDTEAEEAAALASDVEKIILRRHHTGRIDGYTLEMSQEIAARLSALEEAAKVADSESELEGDPPADVLAAMRADPIGVARTIVRVTKKNIAAAIRALATKEKPHG